MTYRHLLLKKDPKKKIAHIQLNRPKALNALNPELISELGECLKELGAEDSVRAVVLSGNEKAFAAGVDIKQMATMGADDMLRSSQFAPLKEISAFKKPLLAAVSGYALGGGCEVAMACDIIIASETAQFGQPEIKLGVIPGLGGTQRLTRAVGKSRAMELILTGDFLNAEEAQKSGLVSRVFPVEEYLEKALEMATKIASMPIMAVKLAKESVKEAYENPLGKGLDIERKNFYLLFDTPDQKEGMAAFVEKRKAKFE